MSNGSHSHQMVNVDRNESEPDIALEYPFETIGHSNNNDDGGGSAGVNAGESINMGFSQSIPFAELVWSPRRGLRVDCADKQSPLFLDVGPSNAGSSPADSEPTKHNGSGSAPSVTHEGQTQNCANSVEGNTMEATNQHFNQVKNEEEVSSRPKRTILDIVAKTSKASAGVSRRTISLGQLINDDAKSDGQSGSIHKMEHIATDNEPIGLGTAMASQSQPVEQFETDRHGNYTDPDLKNKEITSETDSRDPNNIKSKGESNSQQSMESCSSAALFKGKKRLDLEPETIIGSKKMKMQCPSQLAVRPLQSSFRNWISNVIKGLPKKDHELDPGPSLPSHRLHSGPRKTHISGSETKGSQSIFESICNPKKPQETRHLTEDPPLQKTGHDVNPVSVSVKGDESCRRSLDPRENLDHFTPEVGGVSKHTPLFPFENKMVESILESESSSDDIGFHHRTLENGNPFGRPWIKQFYPKEGPNTGSSMGLKMVVGGHGFDDPIKGFQAAMASIFAKKIDTLRQNILDVTEENIHTKKIKCFFCGNTRHELRDCSEVEGNLVDILGRFSQYGRTEDPRAFCIRCFQLDHWAITCPFSFSSLQCKRGSVKCTSTSTTNESSGKEKCGEFDGSIVLDAQRRMFDMIRGLWFSRADIIKLTYSCNSLSDLSGFFVRLRVGKWEIKDLGGSQYHVASIIGLEREKSSENSNDSLHVNIGGIKCSVDIKYVSNHAFLESELKAWREMALRSGNIPNEDELKWKTEERKKLGI